MGLREDGFSAARPTPLENAASKTVKIVGTLSALVVALAGSGIAVLNADQADALTALLGAVPGVLTLVGTALAAFGVVARAKPEVTPVDDPRDNQGNYLVPGNRAA